MIVLEKQHHGSGNFRIPYGLRHGCTLKNNEEMPNLGVSGAVQR